MDVVVKFPWIVYETGLTGGPFGLQGAGHGGHTPHWNYKVSITKQFSAEKYQ